MAQEWCVAYGVLDDDAARRVDKIICTRKGVKQNVIVKKQSNSSSSSSSSSSSNNNSGPASKIGTSTKGMKKKIISSKNTRNEEDFIMDSGKNIYFSIFVYKTARYHFIFNRLFLFLFFFFVFFMLGLADSSVWEGQGSSGL